MALLTSTSTRPRLVEGHLDGVLDRRAVHEVHRYRQAGAPERLDRRRGGVEAPGDGLWHVGRQDARGVGAAVALVHGPGRDGDVEAAPGQGNRGTAPDAAAGASDEGDPAASQARPTYIIPAIWWPPSTWSSWPLT